MYGYLSDFLELTTPGGCTTRLFDGCRTVANAAAGKANGVWEANEIGQTWNGCCCWTYEADSYDPDLNPDPWYDPLNPATSEVAGALIDPPDSGGNGFYLEPSGSLRAREAGFVPLEMYITFTVVAQTARGERAYIDWLMDTLTDAEAECDGFTAEVRTECPCEPDDLTGIVENGELVDPVAQVDPGEPAPTGSTCEPSEELQPFYGALPTFEDPSVRQLLNIRFNGIEQLTDDAFYECAGNRYKLSFQVDTPSWFGQPVELCTLGGADTWDECDCLCDSLQACVPCEPATCGPTQATASTGLIAPPKRVQSNNTVGGLICIEGRYSRPENVMMSTCLTPPQPASIDTRLLIDIVNGHQPVYNARLAVWRAIDGVQRPDTSQGFGYYMCEPLIYDLPIIELQPFEQLTRNADCTTTVTCANGETHSGAGTVEQLGCCEDLSCGDRYWVALMMSCDPLAYGNLDLTATVSTVPLWSI